MYLVYECQSTLSELISSNILLVFYLHGYIIYGFLWDVFFIGLVDGNNYDAYGSWYSITAYCHCYLFLVNLNNLASGELLFIYLFLGCIVFVWDQNIDW